MIHVCSQNWHYVEVNSFEWKVFTLYDFIARWAAPVFFMISGSLLLEKKISYTKLYKKYIFRMILVFIEWSFFYTIVFMPKYGLKQCIMTFIKGWYHLWYLYGIVGLYIITPFLKKIIENKKLTIYYCIIVFVFSFCMPNLVSVLKIYNHEMFEIINTIDYIKLNPIIGFSLYYILGWILLNNHLNPMLEKTICILGIVSIPLGFFLTIMISNYTGVENEVFLEYLTVNIFFESISVFLLLLHWLKKIKFSMITKKNMINLCKYSFGVYLVHPLVLSVLKKYFGFDSLIINPIFSVPLLTFVVVIISYMVSGVLNKLPIIKRYLV